MCCALNNYACINIKSQRSRSFLFKQVPESVEHGTYWKSWYKTIPVRIWFRNSLNSVSRLPFLQVLLATYFFFLYDNTPYYRPIPYYHSSPLDLSFSFSSFMAWISFFSFMRLFWNHIFICLSVRQRRCDSSIRLLLVRYLLNLNSFSSSSVWYL